MPIPIGDESTRSRERAVGVEDGCLSGYVGRGADRYLDMLYERLMLMRELLSEKGTIYVQLFCGRHVKLLLDDVFGRENCSSRRRSMSISGIGARRRSFNPETIFCYTKSSAFTV